MDILRNLFKKKPQPTPQQRHPATDGKTTKHKIAGVTHYENNILTFARPEPLYNKSKKEIIAAKAYNQNIYKYTFVKCPVELVPEPTNPHDPNAVQVVIGGLLVGYIKAGSSKHILNLISANKITNLDYEITGGDFINVWFEADEPQIEKGHLNYGIKLYITERI